MHSSRVRVEEQQNRPCVGDLYPLHGPFLSVIFESWRGPGGGGAKAWILLAIHSPGDLAIGSVLDLRHSSLDCCSRWPQRHQHKPIRDVQPPTIGMSRTNITCITNTHREGIGPGSGGSSSRTHTSTSTTQRTTVRCSWFETRCRAVTHAHGPATECVADGKELGTNPRSTGDAQDSNINRSGAGSVKIGRGIA